MIKKILIRILIILTILAFIYMMCMTVKEETEGVRSDKYMYR